MIDNRLAPYGAFALRFTSGAFFLAHAAMKVFVFTPAGTAKFFESVGLPGPLAYLAIAAEVAGGFALLSGILVRQASLILAVLVLTALYTVHRTNGFFFDNPHGGWEYCAFWAIALIAQALIGEGAFALRFKAAKGPLGDRSATAAA
jgi:putative oxidoreductase